MITQEELKHHLNYNPESGVFYRNYASSNSVKIGDIVGSKTAGGYIQFCVYGKKRLGHRMAWLYVYGSLPETDIDHINGDRADNRITNLRDVTRSDNLCNQRHARSNNRTSGLLGVYMERRRGKYRSRIQILGKTTDLGFFDDAGKAHEAYLAAKRILHTTCTI